MRSRQIHLSVFQKVAVLLLIPALVLAGAWFCFLPLYPSDHNVSSAADVSLSQLLLVDLNHANLQALCTLPGIGEKKAQKILEYRQENGPFACVEDVEKVEGIGEATVAGWAGMAFVS